MLGTATQTTIYIWSKLLDMLLNQMQVDDDIYAGWVIIGVVIISIVISSLLTKPTTTTSGGHKNERSE